MYKINYVEAKKFVIESYNGFIDKGFNHKQLVTGTFEDSVCGIKK